jgi:Tol biopolymer transport system component
MAGCDTRRGAELSPESLIPPPQAIVFASTRDEAHGEIYIMEANGSGVRRLTNNGVQDASPVLSPDGTHILFRRELNPASVFVMRADGTGQVGLAPGKRAEWSPDGAKLALVADSLCVMNADATGKRSLGVGAACACWSPDGTRIAYVSTGIAGQSLNDVYIIHPDGTAPLRITTDGVEKTSIAWSPDGLRLMYTTSQTVYLMHVDGTGLSSPCAGHDARFSPDGQRIVFATDALDGNGEIYSALPDGTDLRNLTRDPAEDSDPDWGLIP